LLISAVVLALGTPADQFAGVNQLPVPSVQVVVWEKAGAELTRRASNAQRTMLPWQARGTDKWIVRVFFIEVNDGLLQYKLVQVQEIPDALANSVKPFSGSDGPVKTSESTNI
jgi:hypothetical protein